MSRKQSKIDRTLSRKASVKPTEEKAAKPGEKLIETETSEAGGVSSRQKWGYISGDLCRSYRYTCI